MKRLLRFYTYLKPFRKGIIALARSTYEGLGKVHGPEYYRSIPYWADPEDMF